MGVSIDTSVEETTQQGQADEIARGDEQELLSAEAPAEEVPPELQSVSGDQSDESAKGDEEGKDAKETSSAETPLKPLKKPKAEPNRPFRRKATRDKTGGPRQKKEEKE